MIVICTKCQAKFRVPDEKIGARGAKVRCSKCQTVFLVRPEGAAAEAAAPRDGTDLAARRTPAAPPVENPFVTAPVLRDPALSPEPRAAPPPLPSSAPPRAPDPFAGPAFAPPAAAPDPFAAAGFAPPAAPDPFAPAPGADPFAPAPRAPAPPEADPFAPPASADPFAPSDASANATDLADLLGAAASAAPPPEPEGEPGFAEPDAVLSATGGIALEERPASPPKPASSAPFDLDPGYDAFADAQGFDPGALELGGPSVEAAPAAPAAAPSAGLAHEAPAADAAPRPVAPRVGAPAAAEPAPHAQERIPGRPSRLRAVAVNAVALAALLVAAVAILVVWRTGDAAALRPSALLAALRGGGAEAPFAARDVRSGLYERDRAPPVLFVRGRVISRAPAPVGRVRVRVEIVREGAVVASGEAIAGAVPTAEEIWATRDPSALARASTAAEPRAPAEVRPGDAVPFLVAIADHPADLAGASVRVEALPAGSGAP